MDLEGIQFIKIKLKEITFGIALKQVWLKVQQYLATKMRMCITDQGSQFASYLTFHDNATICCIFWWENLISFKTISMHILIKRYPSRYFITTNTSRIGEVCSKSWMTFSQKKKKQRKKRISPFEKVPSDRLTKSPLPHDRIIIKKILQN